MSNSPNSYSPNKRSKENAVFRIFRTYAFGVIPVKTGIQRMQQGPGFQLPLE